MQNVELWKMKSDESIRVVAFGSSNTEQSRANQGRFNWVDWLHIMLRSDIGQHVNLINQGRSGNTAHDLLSRIHRDVLTFKPSLVIVTVGGNDSKTDANTSAFADRLRSICHIILQNHAVPVLQTYYCPMFHEGTADYEERFKINTQSVRDVAKELEVPLIDQYRSFEPFYRRNPEMYATMMRDWLHVNHLGNLVMGSIICESFGLSPIPIPDEIKEEAERLVVHVLD